MSDKPEKIYRNESRMDDREFIEYEEDPSGHTSTGYIRADLAKPSPQAGSEAVSAEFALLHTEDQIITWCKRWWQDDAWRHEQKKTYGCDTAHLLRGVADMIEGI